MSRVATVLAFIVALMSGNAATAHANLAPQTPSQPTAAACPVPGQRIKSSTPGSNRVYLVDPDVKLRHIPDEYTYFNLWDSWAGIIAIPQSTISACFPNGSTSLSGAKLAKDPNRPEVYIWDSSCGYRWIRSEQIFNSYQFSWARVTHDSGIFNCGRDWWR